MEELKPWTLLYQEKRKRERDDSRKEKIKEFMMKFPSEFVNTEKPKSGKDPVKFKKVKH